jgi:hypothetical protein
MLDALDLGQDLLRRHAQQTLHLPGRSAGIGDEDIGEGDVDLRLFLARRDQHCEHPEQKAHQGQQRGDFGGEKTLGDIARDTQLHAHEPLPPRSSFR